MNNRKKWIFITIVTILLMVMIIFLVGRSFGFFRYIKKGETINILTINGIEVDIINQEVDTLNLENTYPISDSEGLALAPFEFTMTNTASRSLTYSIKVETDTEKLAACTIEDGSSCPELSTNHIKYAYKKNDGTYTEPRNLGADSNVIASGIIDGNDTVTSSIIIWIDSEAGNEIQGHYFFGRLIIMGAQSTSSNYDE